MILVKTCKAMNLHSATIGATCLLSCLRPAKDRMIFHHGGLAERHAQASFGRRCYRGSVHTAVMTGRSVLCRRPPSAQAARAAVRM